MAFDNSNRGSIWKNEKKEKDTHPDFTGSLNVAGVEYWVSAWKRKEGAPAKAPALSFSVKPKDDQPRAIPVPQGMEYGGRETISQRAQATIKRPDPRITSGLNDDMDDAIPF